MKYEVKLPFFNPVDDFVVEVEAADWGEAIIKAKKRCCQKYVWAIDELVIKVREARRIGVDGTENSEVINKKEENGTT
jgi:hypothetical protein